jgi:hypothetical protein
MMLNDFRDEARDFLAAVGDARCSPHRIFDMLDKELALLKEDTGDPAKLQHQTYDVLFLLFELAAVRDLDLDAEWARGRERKRAKYLKGRPTGESRGKVKK